MGARNGVKKRHVCRLSVYYLATCGPRSHGSGGYVYSFPPYPISDRHPSMQPRNPTVLLDEEATCGDGSEAGQNTYDDGKVRRRGWLATGVTGARAGKGG